MELHKFYRDLKIIPYQLIFYIERFHVKQYPLHIFKYRLFSKRLIISNLQMDYFNGAMNAPHAHNLSSSGTSNQMYGGHQGGFSPPPPSPFYPPHSSGPGLLEAPHHHHHVGGNFANSSSGVSGEYFASLGTAPEKYGINMV